MVEAQDDILRGRTMQLNWRNWYAAAALGGLRTAVNGPHQRTDRARAEAWRVDTAGALAELISIRAVELSGNVSVQSQLLDTGTSVDDVDLRFVVDKIEWALESKCHLVANNHRYFLINERAHDRSRKRGARGYIPVVAHLGSSVAQVGAMIPLEDVDTWSVRTFGDYTDPARYLELSEFEAKYLQGGVSIADLTARPPMVVEDQIVEAFRRGKEALGPFRSEGRTLNNIRTETSINVLLDVIGCWV